jgi:hypothetical protein
VANGGKMLANGILWLVAVVLVACMWGCRRAQEAPEMPQFGPGGPGAPEEMSETDLAKMRAQMLDRMLEEAELSEVQMEAAQEAIAAKDEAREELAEALNGLRRTANKSKPTDQELQQALDSYREAIGEYRSRVEAADAALAEQLPVAAEVRCMSLGVLDNGLGPMRPRGGPMDVGESGPPRGQRPGP